MSRPGVGLSRCIWCGDMYDCGSYPSVYCSPKCRGEAAIEELAKALAEAQDSSSDGWISVNDRLPEDLVGVLAFCPEALTGEPTTVIAWWHDPKTSYGGRWTISGGTWLDKHDITHWQPLPEAPPRSEPEQKRGFGFCRDCQHWSKELAYQDEWGTCFVLTRSGSPYVQNRANLFALPKAPQPFNTNKGFGCVEFQSREEEGG
jgi:hypothetical protein